MTSPPAITFGTIYHIFNRGNNRENIFVEGKNYLYFLVKYAQIVSPITDTYAYCLLRNHFHILVRIKDVEETGGGKCGRKPGQIFGDFFNAYAKAINARYQRTGALFQHPFWRVEVKSDA